MYVEHFHIKVLIPRRKVLDLKIPEVPNDDLSFLCSTLSTQKCSCWGHMGPGNWEPHGTTYFVYFYLYHRLLWGIFEPS